MYRIAVIGSGDRGSTHAATWAAREDAKVVAVCDIDEARRERLAGIYGASAYEDYREAIAHERVDIVSVCVPTWLHAPVIVEAARRGIHLMAEKPLALNREQAVEIEQAIAASGVFYTACFQHRDRGLYQLFNRFFSEGRLGSPVHFRFTDIRDVRPKTAMHRVSQNGGVVIDMACHMFDMLGFITGDQVVRVYASGDIFGRGKPTLAGIDDLAIDAASVELDTARGHHASLYFNWGMPEHYVAPGNGPVLIGPLGSVHSEGGKVILTSGDHREVWPDADPGMTRRIDRLVGAIEAGEPLDITYREARTSLDLSLAAFESIKSREAVLL